MDGEQPETPTERISGYHAHVYFDEGSVGAAEQVRDGVAKRFPMAVLGRWHHRPVGPHPDFSFQIAFDADLFGRIVPWLTLNRHGLNIFVHPETGDELADHRDRTIWLGESRPLDLSIFS